MKSYITIDVDIEEFSDEQLYEECKRRRLWPSNTIEVKDGYLPENMYDVQRFELVLNKYRNKTLDELEQFFND